MKITLSKGHFLSIYPDARCLQASLYNDQSCKNASLLQNAFNSSLLLF